MPYHSRLRNAYGHPCNYVWFLCRGDSPCWTALAIGSLVLPLRAVRCYYAGVRVAMQDETQRCLQPRMFCSSAGYLAIAFVTLLLPSVLLVYTAAAVIFEASSFTASLCS